MATKEVTLLRSFGFEDDDGKQHYFTRDNQDMILEIVGEGNLQPYVDGGIIEVYDGHELQAKTSVHASAKGGIRPSVTTAAARPATKKEG